MVTSKRPSENPARNTAGEYLNPVFPKSLRSHRNEENRSCDVAGSRNYRRRANRLGANPSDPPPSGRPPQRRKRKKSRTQPNITLTSEPSSRQDAAAKISGLEAFLTQYPNSVMKEDALELLMGAYEQTETRPKTLDTAQKVLQANPCNLRALALLSYTKRALAEAGQQAQPRI